MSPAQNATAWWSFAPVLLTLLAQLTLLQPDQQQLVTSREEFARLRELLRADKERLARASSASPPVPATPDRVTSDADVLRLLYAAAHAERVHVISVDGAALAGGGAPAATLTTVLEGRFRDVIAAARAIEAGPFFIQVDVTSLEREASADASRIRLGLHITPQPISDGNARHDITH